MTRRLLRASILACLGAAASSLDAQTPSRPASDSMVSVPAYRARLLGVYDADTGNPIEGAEVSDVLTRVSALTTKTGTVALIFLPDSGSLVRIQKIGYQPTTMAVAISPVDTVPITVVLSRAAQSLPAVVSKETGRKAISPGLQSFEERSRHGMGTYITEAQLRKSDDRKMQDVLRASGVNVQCTSRGPYMCFAVSVRQPSKMTFAGGSCAFDVYLDGMAIAGDNRDLDKMQVNEYAGIEIYKGAATIPPEYNMTGSSCGVILMWTRERI